MNDWFYKHKEHGLTLTFKLMVEAGISDNTLKSAIQRNSNTLKTIPHPDDARKVLIIWSRLAEKYRKLVDTYLKKRSGCKHTDTACTCGDPANFFAKEPIREMITKDYNAETFYLGYRYCGPTGNDHLPSDTVSKYCREADWLGMLNRAEADKKGIIKKGLGVSLEEFYSHVIEMLTADQQQSIITGKFPTSYQRLRAKMESYSAESYPSLIHPSFGNKNSAKIGKTETGYNPQVAAQQEALIRTAASKHNNFDAMQITRAVNQIFKMEGLPEVSHTTVYNRMEKNGHLTKPGSNGKRAYNNTVAMQVKRSRPDYALTFWTLDGWTVELLFQDATGFHHRLVMVVVLDACNNYPIGYAIGDRENSSLIKEALRNAMLHVRELTGEYHRPLQIQSDNYAVKELTPFYQAVGQLFTPAAVGNAKSKVIEPYFKDLNHNYCQYMPNWSGHNLNASKGNQVNAEMLDKIKHSFPDRAGVVRQIEGMMAQERRLKAADYFQRWQATPADRKQLMQSIDWLLVFGQPTGFLNTLTGQGLCPTINGQRMVYDSFEPAFRQNAHQRFEVIYDENDLTQVLAITEDKRSRFVLEQKRAIPMSVYDATEADHAYRSQITGFNADRRKEIMDTYASDAEAVAPLIEKHLLNPDSYDEAAMKLMFTHKGQQKEGIQDAKRLGTARKKLEKMEAVEAEAAETNWQQQQMEYLRSRTNVNEYLNP